MQDYKQKISQLKWLKLMGVDHSLHNDPAFKEDILQTIEKNNIERNNIIKTMPKATKAKKPSTTSNQVNAKPKNSPPDSNVMLKARKLADEADNLDTLKTMVENFDGCQLKKFATNTVFSDGVRNAKVLIMGEAPGANEDEQGRPFCGESGKLLDKMLESIGLSRTTNAYITNSVFWRPPANRRPTQEEIDICRPFVEKHIALINPDLIILVGAVAATSLLGKHEGISNLRQNTYFYNNEYLSQPIALRALFHPAYLLRQPSQKKSTWYDLIRIKQYLQEKSIANS